MWNKSISITLLVRLFCGFLFHDVCAIALKIQKLSNKQHKPEEGSTWKSQEKATKNKCVRFCRRFSHILFLEKSQTICFEFMELNNLKWQSHVNNGAHTHVNIRFHFTVNDGSGGSGGDCSTHKNIQQTNKRNSLKTFNVSAFSALCCLKFVFIELIESDFRILYIIHVRLYETQWKIDCIISSLCECWTICFRCHIKGWVSIWVVRSQGVCVA